MKKYFFTKLTTRIVTTFALLAIPGALLVGITSYTLSRNALEESVYEKLGTITNLKEDELRHWIQTKKIQIERIARSRFVRDRVKLVRMPEGVDTGTMLDAYEELAGQLAYFKANEVHFREIFLLTWEEGRVFLSTDKTHEGDYRINDAYFTQGREGTYIQNVFLSPVISRSSIVVSTPLLSSYGEKLGVMAAHIDLDRMDEVLFGSLVIGRTGDVYLVDRNSNFVSARRFGSEKFPRGVHSVGIETATGGESGSGLYLNYNDTPVIGVYKWLDDLDLAILAEIQQDEAFAPARNLGLNLFLVAMGIATAVLLASVLLAIKISRPIQMVQDAAARVAGGDLMAKAPVVTGDEVGMLAASFNEMTDQLDLLYKALQASEEHFRSVFRLSPDAISVTRMSDDTVVDINEGFTNITGFARKQIVGHTTREIGLWMDEKTRDEFLNDLKEHGYLDKQQIEFFRKDGSTFVGSISARKVEISGEPHRISVIRDVTELRAAEEDLLKANTILKTQMETSVSGILVVDSHGKMISFNRRFVEMWSIPGDILDSKSDERAIQSVLDQVIDPEAFLEKIHYLYINTSEHSQDEVELLDGRIFERHSAPMQDEHGQFYGRVWYFRDVTAARKSETSLRASVLEKEVLLQEIHHRVKNNLQVISGLLDLQRYHITDQRGKQIYKESQNRVITMALIHEELYQARDLAQVEYGPYLKNLVNNLFKSYAVEPERITLNIEAEDIQIVVDTAIPCGLIINELVSNSLKHAFPNGREGKISIIFRQLEEEKYYMEVSDNGVGIPADLDIKKTSSLGLQLVTVLVDQLKGEMEISSTDGTTFAIHLTEYREAGTKMY